MNNRLNKSYEEIDNVEDMITDCEKRRVAAEQNTLTKDNVYKMLLVFDKLFDKMNDTDKRKLLESLISEVRLHPKETWAEGKNPIKEIKYAFPVGDEIMKSLRENVTSLETVVQLTRK
jgi:site-specific DNA recombinase